ncbi:nudix hydrolase 3-like protein [Trifolium pratense]|uniref:Nudix hydrolase 3-like protein n=1 Tax=Trifolium pratense TaxID=57577 RepID=A0A2K3MRR3_TRIPR|nr:nudix hydrolase 3-like protein [Trifolium pratense]
MRDERTYVVTCQTHVVCMSGMGGGGTPNPRGLCVQRWSIYLSRSTLDDDEAFLTTADSAIRLLTKATRTVREWKGLEYRAAFPILKPAGANFYPADMDKREFNIWNDSLAKDQQQEATSFFTVIRRHSEFILDSGLSNDKVDSSKDLYIVPYSQEYKSLLAKAADFLHKAGDITNSTSLKKLLHSKADAFLSNDYYNSDISWMELQEILYYSGPISDTLLEMGFQV